MIGTLAISLTATYAGYWYITNTPEIKDNLVGTVVPSAVFFAITYTVGNIFMGVYGIAIEAIM